MSYKARTQDHRLQRLDESQLALPNAWDIPVRVFANAQIPLQREAIDELLNVLSIQGTVEALQRAAPDFFDRADPRIQAVALTPDFHKGAGIPIGTVLATRGFAVPQAIGNDVNCGMRLMTTGLTREQVAAHQQQGNVNPQNEVWCHRRLAAGAWVNFREYPRREFRPARIPQRRRKAGSRFRNQS